MSPTQPEEKKSSGSQFGMILLIILLVIAIGIAYFKLTGTLL